MAAEVDGKVWRIPFSFSYGRRGSSNTWAVEMKQEADQGRGLR